MSNFFFPDEYRDDSNEEQKEEDYVYYGTSNRRYI